jgi:predicted ArsR family transcriptional regulator
MTVDQLADALSLTRTAIRSQLALLQHDGLVEHRELRRGTSKPSRTYGVSEHAELMFSRAYIPILTKLLHVLSRKLSVEEFDGVMREVGREIMAGHVMPRGPLRERVMAASGLLNELGGSTEVVAGDGRFTIRSSGCPLAAATASHPEACNAIESMLTEFVGASVAKCCDRTNRAQCCFEVQYDASTTQAIAH